MGGQIWEAKKGRQKWAAKIGRPKTIGVGYRCPCPLFVDFTVTRTRLARGLGTRWEDPTRTLTPTYHWPVRNYII
jgi:hypothetical protein